MKCHLGQIITRSVSSSPTKSSSVVATSVSSNESGIPSVVPPFSSSLTVVDPISDSSLFPGLGDLL